MPIGGSGAPPPLLAMRSSVPRLGCLAGCIDFAASPLRLRDTRIGHRNLDTKPKAPPPSPWCQFQGGSNPCQVPGRPLNHCPTPRPLLQIRNTVPICVRSRSLISRLRSYGLPLLPFHTTFQSVFACLPSALFAL